jgi:uncharacterized protein YndB with AHSA1/START domain
VSRLGRRSSGTSRGVIEATASRVIPAAAAAVWAVAADGARLQEWFALVQSSEASGAPGPGQRHTVRGPWATGDEFEIDRVVELWEPERRVLWRDVAERLGGVRPADMWHDGTWLEVLLEPETGGTRVTLVGRQRPAPGWEERLTAARPATERMLQESLERLEQVVAAEPA